MTRRRLLPRIFATLFFAALVSACGEDEQPLAPGVTTTGVPGIETVSAGGVVTSETYRLVFTFGQPTMHQATATSSKYRLQGGVVGNTEGPP